MALDGRWRRDPACTSLVAEQPRQGQRCAKVDVPHGSAAQGAQFYTDLPAQPGAEYRIAAWMRSQDVAGQGYAFMAVYQYDAAGKMVAFRDFGFARGTTPWRQHVYTFTAQRGAVRLHVMLGLYNAQGTAWFDDFRLAEITGLAFEPMNTARGRPEDGLVVSARPVGHVRRLISSEAGPRAAVRDRASTWWISPSTCLVRRRAGPRPA